MVLSAAALFCAAWIFSPGQGLLQRFLHRKRGELKEPDWNNEAAIE
jgi:hypothetical protein